jgi:hypothetical protein
MALFYEVSVSPGTQSGPPSLADAAFIVLGSLIPDMGSGFSLAHLESSTPPVIAGALFTYRARRFDDSTGLWSDYSALAFARAPFSFGDINMPAPLDGTLDTVITGASVKLGIGLEDVYGGAVKAQKLLEIISLQPGWTITKLYAKILRATTTMRSKVAPGPITLDLSANVLVTPEGGFPILLKAFLPDTVTGTSGPSGTTIAPYTHTFKNAPGAKSVTLLALFGFAATGRQYLFVMGGCRVQSASFAQVTAEASDVLTVSVKLNVLTIQVFDLVTTPGDLARCGMDTAAADTLNPYSGPMAESSISTTSGTVYGSFKSMAPNFTWDMPAKRTLNRTRGASQYYQTKMEPAGNIDTYFEDIEEIAQSWGNTSSAAPLGIGMSTILVPVNVTFSPPANGSGYVNTLGFYWPNVTLDTTIDAKDEKEVAQTTTIQSVDPVGNAAGTDFELTLVNGLSDVTLSTTSAPIPNFPASAATLYFSAVVNASPSPTTTAFTSDAGNIASFSTTANDPIYLSKSIYFMSGVNVGLSRRISAYVAPTGGLGGAFTYAAFPNAPTAGDNFCIR